MLRPIRFAVCGAGFIGTSLLEEFLREGYAVNVLDHKDPPASLAGRTNWFRGEFADESLLRRTLAGVDVAYHFVSTTVPGDDHVGLFKELADNIATTIRFLDVCLMSGVKRVVFASSSSVYGVQERTPIAESSDTNPISSHGIQKLTIEKYLQLYRFNHDLDVRIVRLSNPYGPGQNIHGRQGLIAIAIGKLLAGEPILLRDHGSPVRDFIYIDDVSDALVRVGTVEDAPPMLNIGTGVGHSLAQVIHMLGELSGLSLLVTNGALRKADISVSVLDVSRARESLGFQPRTSLRGGLIKTLRYHGVGISEI